MIANIQYWIKESELIGNDLETFNHAVEVEDYNLMRVIIDGVIDDIKQDIDDNLLANDLEVVASILPRYRTLLQLEELILEQL
ncbi:MAG: hypothetical protein ACOC3V_00425 [bacterium]